MRYAVFIFLIVLIDLIYCWNSKRSFFIPDFLGSGDGTPKSKTESVIEERMEYGRMILLVCNKTCAKHRSDIPLWLKEFNQKKGYQEPETITYYYHTYRQAVSFIDTNETDVFPNLIYFIGVKRVVFNGDVNIREDVNDWIASLDQLILLEPRVYEDLNVILSDTSNCSSKYLLLADRPKCPQPSWSIVARIAQDHGIQPVKIGHPLDGLTHVLLYKRMPYLSEASCHLSVLLYENSYSDFGDDINPLVVSDWITTLLPLEEGSCPALFETYWHPIVDELTELQQIFYSAELEISERNKRPAFVLVGLTGGIAVIILAFSIFWGLNGSGFNKD
ncbi:Putative potassium channel regulatory protein sup-10 [Caenorhabditis elegans]|uniref:Putative potassium channel regulatory protein sup-10 n=1 Tax=Caenorhabditis elegans TaxID=6239 RepID=SUP10_CAEEL|nr:Putative potassium channel regulatory protein sup-10 [Caenorhabditis elegans]Q17374.2 RecName: Full=Putative potassium channel regulatory protein sup-10; AltName: Full=Suppressor of unc-93 protein 10; Flags: Precursor [Caenorhabditis elegans]AAB61087.1 SUP-10 precursor [Caenorhabditis elegans]CCD70295.1 Putative potassium channel regulatory protein sup-10 [Caenorhabditis elegans]|eukprot:NP_510835.1 Putative potassium channel regulatory protein sup-10 [Caenorhabditis elegans]